jgi:hypothetical protein
MELLWWKEKNVAVSGFKLGAIKRDIMIMGLNSMWGKLTERNNRTKTKMISDPQELYRFLATPGIEVGNLLFASDAFIWASWQYIDENIPSLRHTNDVTGASVTAGARLHLYSFLHGLEEKALYCDTDSVCSTYSVTTNRR